MAGSSWELFEREVSELVEAFGYEAETTQPSHDYGVDVVATHSRRRVVIQCKLYGRGRIGGNVISQLAGSRELFEASDAVCITTSKFTRQAREIALKLNIYLVDREMLMELCSVRRLTIPSLTVLTADTGEAYETTAATQTIGRLATCEISIPNGRVSRRHAVLERRNLVLKLLDADSTNGTYLNGKRLLQPRALCYGDEVRIGSWTAIVTLRVPTSS